MPKPVKVTEGNVSKFCCRLSGLPKPRVLWIVNGTVAVAGSKYKIRYDGMHHLEIPKTQMSDKGKVEVYAKNPIGEAYCWTNLYVYPKNDDYRVVLRNSPSRKHKFYLNFIFI